MKRYRSFDRKAVSMLVLITVAGSFFVSPGIEKQSRDIRTMIGSSGNFSRLDGVNITLVNVGYESGGYFSYEVYGYFIDTSPPYAGKSTCIASIEYLNFTSGDVTILANGSRYSNSSFYATIYDGASFPNVMILPESSYTMTDFRETFCVKFKLPVAVCSPVNITVRLTDFANANDTASFMNDTYDLSYNLKTNLVVNSQYFSKSNIIVSINNSQVDPYDFHVDSLFSDLKIHDMEDNLIYHDSNRKWSSNLAVDFTSARITNDFYTSVLASIAPLYSVDQSFYQNRTSNFSIPDRRFTERGSFNRIYQGAEKLVYGADQRTLATSFFPTDSIVDTSWNYNVYDGNDTTMPVSMNFSSARYEYPFFLVELTSGDRYMSYWIRTPGNENETIFAQAFGSPSTNITDGVNFMYGIFNGSLWNMTRYFKDDSSFANCQKIMTIAPGTWYNIAVIMGSFTENASIFVDFKKVFSLDTGISGHSQGFLVMNHTTLNSTNYHGEYPITKNASSAIRTTFNLANVYTSSSAGDVDNLIVNGESSIKYANDTTAVLNATTRGGFYRALSMRYKNTVLPDFMNFMYVPDSIVGISNADISGIYGTGFSFSNVQFLKSFDGHSNVASLGDLASINFDFSVTSGNVLWGGPLGQWENSTLEFWVNTKNSTGGQSVTWYESPPGINAFILGFDGSNALMNIFYGVWSSHTPIFDQTIFLSNSTWNHIRMDILRKNGSSDPAVGMIYVNGVSVANVTGVGSCKFDPLSFSGYPGHGSVYIDAIGFWRNSWTSNLNYRDFYSIGRNEQELKPLYPYGMFTFDSNQAGQDITAVSSNFVNDPRVPLPSDKNAGNVTQVDPVHNKAYSLYNPERWETTFVFDIPANYPIEYIFPNGYGYDVRGRTSFWFYANSSKGASKYLFGMYDDGGTKYDLSDDRFNGFVVGNAFDDSDVSSKILYFKRINGTNYIKDSGYVLSNDTWIYIVFEWNSTGNVLWINQKHVFDGDTVLATDFNAVLESNYTLLSLWSYFWVNFESKNALAYFLGLVDTEENIIIRQSSARTCFMFRSIPRVDYLTLASKIGAVWHSSLGYIDNVNFEYDTTIPHDYRPSMISIQQIASNFTIHASLGMIYSASLWRDFNLYDGAFYNVTFKINSTIGSYPLQVYMGSSEYVIFTSGNITTVSILHPIDVTAAHLSILMWSINGTYKIQDFAVTLTSRFPATVDAFKKYMRDLSVFSRFIGMNADARINITAGSYYILAESIPSTDVAYFDEIIISGGSNDIYILPPSLRDITVSYTDQRGTPVLNIRTFLKIGDTFVLQPSNVFQAEIETTITILSKNVFNEVVFYGSYTVRSFSNYINIITVVHSLMIYNQDEYFANYTITKSFTPGFYWSRYIYPKTGAEEKLTSGLYTITVRDHLGSVTMYDFSLFGDDYLLINSDLTIQNAINNIRNVNTTIGNQITSVAINITNQNSAINNSVVNVDINLSNINSTLGTQLLSMSAEVLSVNSTINEQTIYITSLMANLNTTIFSQTSYITSLIANINASIDNQTTYITTWFTNINSTILSQYITMTSLLVQINNTINSVDVNLTQAFFTDLSNNQTSNLTGYISQTLNNQTQTLVFQLNELQGFIQNETLNLQYGIYNSTISLNGSMNLQFSQISASNAEIRDLIRRTDFTPFVNWSNNSEVLGIVELKIMNSYDFPIICQLKFRSQVSNFTIYANNFVSQYVPTGTYQYRLIRQPTLNDTSTRYLARYGGEPEKDWPVFKTIFIDNSSRVIETSFASIPASQVPSALETTQVGLIVVLGMIGLVIFLVIRSQIKKKDAKKKMLDGKPTAKCANSTAGSRKISSKTADPEKKKKTPESMKQEKPAKQAKQSKSTTRVKTPSASRKKYTSGKKGIL